MSEASEVWPPAPKPPGAAQVEVKKCPACGRKLLTQTSALCNWCGAKIDDPEYQARAAQTRQANDEAERARVEALVQEEAQFGILGRLRRRAKLHPGRKSEEDLLR